MYTGGLSVEPRRNGFKQSELVKVYQSMIRPVAEYCSAIFHALITDADSWELERIQTQVLKRIFGWKLSYSCLLESSGLERLDVRKEECFVKLGKKMSESGRHAHCFPLRVDRRTGLRPSAEKFKIYPARTERYLRAPLNQMRR